MKIFRNTTAHSDTADIYTGKVSAHVRLVQPGICTATVLVGILEYCCTIFSGIGDICNEADMVAGCPDESGELMSILGFQEVPR